MQKTNPSPRTGFMAPASLKARAKVADAKVAVHDVGGSLDNPEDKPVSPDRVHGASFLGGSDGMTRTASTSLERPGLVDGKREDGDEDMAVGGLLETMLPWANLLGSWQTLGELRVQDLPWHSRNLRTSLA
jgi:hypothetical protein